MGLVAAVTILDERRKEIMNTITIELCAEDRARLDAILAALQKAPNCDKCVKDVAAALSTPQAPKNEPKNEPQSDEKKEVKENTESPAFVAAEEAPPWEADVPKVAPKHTKADLQQKVVNMVASGADKAKVRSIINEYAERVSLVPEDKLDEAMARLEALEG